MTRVFIVGAKRTPIGRFGGSLSDVSAAKLGGISISAALLQSNVPANQIDEVIVGNVLSAGQGMGPARQASVHANIPHEVPAFTLNMICGSGMKTIVDASSKIKCGDANIVVAAGMENMSQAPYILDAKNRFGSKMGHQEVKDSLIKDGLTDAFHGYHMGVTAENVASYHKITREEQDRFALRSQHRALDAIESQRFENEIVAVEIENRGSTVLFSHDEYPRETTTFATLSKLKPAFDKAGTVTAGNASGINDGSAAFVLASEHVIDELSLEPIAEVISYGQGGVDPSVMGLGPVPAIRQALKRASLQLTDMDLLELNEAFSAQALGVMKALAEEHDVTMDWFDDKTNLNGGAIALGHPLGASGGRILVTLLYEMIRQDKKLGLASLCIGGGMGTAVILKRP
ncbi:acetyl-CoA C-acetyltransferase [Vibrio sp. 10N.261.55.A7]|uniref:acetyl-CoA C-acetyltransferase n=1 Tax=Vibrio sp. 10N.261.55.A7 TaxID=1880851 RepID=UPI000C838E08|nr:acetyl-CoA C-acetyltransferase [Vibrio sp. 10N.261.55.A7]PMK03386.1 acetyl-CoA acetyltransferase [Vibrio sp. 10N.261.55.A7]